MIASFSLRNHARALQPNAFQSSGIEQFFLRVTKISRNCSDPYPVPTSTRKITKRIYLGVHLRARSRSDTNLFYIRTVMLMRRGSTRRKDSNGLLAAIHIRTYMYTYILHIIYVDATDEKKGESDVRLYPYANRNLEINTSNCRAKCTRRYVLIWSKKLTAVARSGATMFIFCAILTRTVRMRRTDAWIRSKPNLIRINTTSR